jgi:hypothetical protein
MIKQVIILLSFLSFTFTKCVPSLLYSRLDPKWKDYVIVEDGTTIGYRADIIKPFPGDGQYGTLLSLMATVQNDFNFQCNGEVCTPLSLYQYVEKVLPDEILKVLHVIDVIAFISPSHIDWTVVNDVMKVNSSLYFITKPVENNIVGNMYDIDMTNQTFKYYDALGNTGVGKFEDVVYMDIYVYEVSSLALKFLE